MKAIIIYCLIMIAFTCHAQYCDTTSFQKIIWNKGIRNARAKVIFPTLAGSIYLTGETESATTGSEDMWIAKTTPGGNILWSKNIGLPNIENINGIKYTDDGGFIGAGYTTSAATYPQGWLVKTDSDANVQWSLAVGGLYSNLTQVVHLRDGGYAASGVLYTSFSGDSAGNISSVKTSTNIILRFTEAGQLVWYRSFRHTNTEELKSVRQLLDNNLLVTGVVSNTFDGYLIKIDESNGNILWMNQYSALNHYSFPHAIEQADGSIHLHVDNKTFYLTSNGHFYDGKEIELNSGSLNLNNVQVNDYSVLYNEVELYSANLYPKHSPVLFAIQNDSAILWARDYEQSAANLKEIENGKVFKSSIYLAGSYITSNFSDNSNSENLTYLIKTDANGFTLCSDTFNVSFKINSIAYPADVTHDWINEGTLAPTSIYPYTEVLSGNTQNDCAVKNCCTALETDTTVNLCSGNYYYLPPNDSLVKTSGIYGFHYYTSRGCDSIYNYNVNFKSFFHFSLDDTCFISNQPVTLLLPADSSVKYKWQNGTAGNSFTVTAPGKYWFTATSACNIFYDTVTVSSACLLPVYVPSAFTPNGDGRNDIFHVAGLNGQRLINLSVFNRYGQHIFNTENNFYGWNGTLNGIAQPSGTYVYVVRYFDLQGIVHQLQGTVVLIR